MDSEETNVRTSKYLLGAVVAGLAAAAATVAVHGQSAPAQTPPAAAPNWAPVTNPDALIELNDQKTYNVTYSLDQRGCVPSAKVYGNQPIAIDGYYFGGCLARGADKNLDAMRLLVKAAQAVGSIHSNAYYGVLAAYLDLGDTVSVMRTDGSGTWNGEKVGIRMDWDYRVPGLRLYITHADKSQDIYVASDPSNPPTGRIGHLEQPELFGNGPKNWNLVAWKDKPVGHYAGPSDMAPQDLMALALLMPSNIVLAGRDAADKISAGKSGQLDTLTIPEPALGGANLVATLAADGHPTHAEVKVNGKTYAEDFSGYQVDRMEVGAFVPHHVVIQVDGKPLADYQLDFSQVNPYLVFPVPTQVATQK
jgi:hypothetical protein